MEASEPNDTVHVHNGDIVLAMLRMILKADNLSDAQAMAQTAIDFATDDQEALAEGRALQHQGEAERG